MERRKTRNVCSGGVELDIIGAGQSLETDILARTEASSLLRSMYKSPSASPRTIMLLTCASGVISAKTVLAHRVQS